MRRAWPRALLLASLLVEREPYNRKGLVMWEDRKGLVMWEEGGQEGVSHVGGGWTGRG